MNDELQVALSRLEESERRLSELARHKSRVELVNNLLGSLSSVVGLDNMVQRIINILMQTIGAANISVTYNIGQVWQMRDVYGAFRESKDPGDSHVISVLETGKPVRITNTEVQVPYQGETGAVTAQNWIFPLLSQGRKIGAVCMEGMQLNDFGIFEELQPFFAYAGLMLDNEISNFSLLAEAHRRLQESENLYRTLFEQSPDGIVLWSLPSLRPIQFNTTAHTLLGYSRDEFALLTVNDIHLCENPKQIDGYLEAVARGESTTFTAVHRTKDGKRLTMTVSLKMFEQAGQKMILAIHHDITELKESNRNLELYRYSLDNARDSIFLLQNDARFCFVNLAACAALGYTPKEFTAMHAYDIDPDLSRKVWKKHWEAFKAHGTLSMESRHRTKDDELIPVEIGIRMFEFEGVEYLLAVARDLRERMRLEEERRSLEQKLLQTQKLESLGVLAGGIAHDFNNILMAVLGNADLALMRLSKESPAIENLKNIEKAAARAADLAKQMLAYSGKGKFVLETLDLNALLEEMMHMLQVSISKKAVLRLNLTDPLPSVEVDATQIRQIIMNLVINASEAIGDKSGVIAITTGCMDCDRSYLKDVWLMENLSEGLYVYLEIADTGCGMDKDTLSRIFEPFFTTKFTGRGLGMAAVLGIVKGHKGAIKVYSEEGKGTSFKVLLPSSDRPADFFHGEDSTTDWHGSGTVLLVDDEETVRGIGAAMLKELGFVPVTAEDGRAAIDIFKDRPDIIFVILDLTMPHMDGEQCFRELRRLKPDVQVIMTSGYSENDVAHKFLGKGLAGFIQKPYNLSALKEVIKRAVGAG
ncbi:PAS domain-containing hybrid sensor histidine kinase/response regulator [Citrifermentans bremense]|uniref:PAS domain-containing hybrid sensor histidine kinase/response regulator n=1 Tax=Citrifermentans bremense TaxID=60035 RepID=UPI0004082708|nr:PAS domain S-box protein [Citrifermentans bremense]